MNRTDAQYIDQLLEVVERETGLDGWEAKPGLQTFEEGDSFPIRIEPADGIDGPWTTLEVPVDYPEAPEEVAARAKARLNDMRDTLRRLLEAYTPESQ